VNLKELLRKCKECDKCRLRKTATQVVPGAGGSNAEIMFIGEAPGANEDKEGIPFCGAAGKFLDELLDSIDLKREDVFITNIVKCRPPGNRDPQEDEIKACKSWTNKIIKAVNPKIFVLLGRFAMGKFFPKFQISKVHGNAYKKWDRLFFLMYHPAVALYNGSFRDVLFDDVRRLRNLLDGDESKVILVEEEKSEIATLMKKRREEKKKKKKKQLGMKF